MECSALNEIFIPHQLLVSLRDCCRRGDRKIVKPEVETDNKETVLSGHIRRTARMNSAVVTVWEPKQKTTIMASGGEVGMKYHA